MPTYRVTVCSGVFDIDAKDEDEAIDDALSQADYDVEEIEDDEDEDDDELDDDEEEETLDPEDE